MTGFLYQACMMLTCSMHPFIAKARRHTGGLPFGEAKQQNTLHTHPIMSCRRAGQHTEVSCSTIIQLTLAPQRAHRVIHRHIQHKRNAAIKLKECS